MARDEAPPWARGETYNNLGSGGLVPIDSSPFGLGALGLGGVNYEGKEYVFEPNSQDDFLGTYSNASTDPNGRPIRVKIVRNLSGGNLLPARLVHYNESAYDPDSGQSSFCKLETAVDGYVNALADKPAGVVDEFLPPGGVAVNDLFYIVIDGPTIFTASTSGLTVAVGSVLVPGTFGATRNDPLGGRVALQDLTGASTVLAQNIIHQVGKAEVATTTASNAVFAGVIHRAWK